MRWKEGASINRNLIDASFLKSYLKDIKKLIVADNYTVANRGKNRKFMIENGLDTNDIKDVMLALTPNDCISSCERDLDGYP